MNRSIATKLWGVSVLWVAAGLSGCAQPPSLELTEAQRMLDSAVAAEAEQYAADELTYAKAELEYAKAEVEAQDETFVLARNYDAARDLLNNARKKAENAVNVAKHNREEAAAEVDSLIVEVEGQIELTQAAFEQAPRGKDTEEDLAAIQENLKTLTAAVDSAKALAADGEYFDAWAALTETRDRANEVAAALQTAREKSRGRRS